MNERGTGESEDGLELHNGERKRLARIVEWIVIALAIVLGVLVIFFVREYILVREERILSAHQAFESLLERHGPLTASDANAIRTWMTFDYINRAFKLPASYLQTTLPVSDPHYPQLSIAAYAHDENESQGTALSDVETAITDYFNSASSSAGGANATTTP